MSTAWGFVCLTHDPELHKTYLAHNAGGRDELAKLPLEVRRDAPTPPRNMKPTRKVVA